MKQGANNITGYVDNPLVYRPLPKDKYSIILSINYCIV